MRPLSPSRKPQAITNSEVERRFWCTSRTRCAHPLNSERHPDPSDAWSPRAPRRTAGNRLYAFLHYSPPLHLRFCLRARQPTQTFSACNSPRVSSQAMPLARRIPASCTAPCPLYRCSARSIASTATARSPTSPHAATLTVDLGASQVPRAMPHKVRASPHISLPPLP